MNIQVGGIMKKIFLIFSLIGISLFVLAACSNSDPLPEDRFAAYTKLWNEQDYDSMYDYLSKDAKEKITKEVFTERYQKIYEGIEVENLQVTYKTPEETKKYEEGETATLPFSVSMETVAGPVTFDHKATMVQEEKEEEINWYVGWDTTYIFPELELGEEVSVDIYPAIRGEIVDRLERGLAINRTVMEVSIVPEEITDRAAVVSQVARLLNLSTDEIEAKLNQSWVQPNYKVPIIKLSLDQNALINKLVAIPSVKLHEVPDRVYPYKEAAAHLVGYIGDITAEELKTWSEKGYTASDEIGKRGLEQIYEERLKGKPGAKISIQNESGMEKVIAEKPAEEGDIILLTIDAELQKSIFAQYKNEAGTAAALDPKTGEALALVSSPSFDPNQFVLGISSNQRQALENNPAKPLLNRFSSTYSPGSSIKALTGSIALKNGIDPAEAIQINGKTWSKENWTDHSITRVADPGKPINMMDAFIYSDNIYFAQKALQVGTAAFTSGMKDFGFEEKIPFEYPITASSYGTIDSEGRLADSGYGQGQMQMSSLHLALSYTAFVNEGNILKPKLMLDANNSEPEIWKKNAISPEQSTQILTMIKQVVEHPSGSANDLSKIGIPLAGKTGTAELKQNKNETGTENGWFVGINTDNPRLLMAWMVEGVQGRGGSKVPVNLTVPIWQQYLKTE
jgi:cell division protein FtsI/penicillin-binding protein 2